jgi:hypothetical protein
VRSAREVEEVSIIDPRHALYGQKLRLVQVANGGKEETSSCTVELRADVWRRIPLGVTNLSSNQPVLYPLPVNLLVVRQLLALFRRIEIQCQEASSDENNKKASGGNKAQRTKGSPTTLAMPEQPTTTKRSAKRGSSLLADDTSTQASAGGKRC